jgi:hypothetical protein
VEDFLKKPKKEQLNMYMELRSDTSSNKVQDERDFTGVHSAKTKKNAASRTWLPTR